MIYEYNLGDSWKQDILLEKKYPPEPDVVYPRCIKGNKACPPEDSRGVGEYFWKLECLNDPNHEEHQLIKEWLGEEFDPEIFDLDSVNKALKNIKF